VVLPSVVETKLTAGAQLRTFTLFVHRSKVPVATSLQGRTTQITTCMQNLTVLANVSNVLTEKSTRHAWYIAPQRDVESHVAWKTVLVQCRIVSDRQTDGQTDRHSTTPYTALL